MVSKKNLCWQFSHSGKKDIIEKMIEPLAQAYKEALKKSEESEILSTKVNQLQDELNVSVQKHDEIINKLNQLSEKVTTVNTPTYAAIASQPKQDQQKQPNKLTNYFVSPENDNISIDKVEEALKKTLKSKRIRINDMKRTKNEKSIRIISPDTDVVEQINSVIGEDMIVEKEKPFLPEIFIHNVGEDFDQQIEELKDRNDLCDDDKISVARVMEQKRRINGKIIYNAIIRLTGKSLNKLNKAGRIYLGYSSLRFRENFYVKKCTNCYSYGHTSRGCHHEHEATCHNCGTPDSNNHRCDISRKEPHCPYCYRMGYFYKRNIKFDHDPSDVECCKSFQIALDKLQRKIDYNYG